MMMVPETLKHFKYLTSRNFKVFTDYVLKADV